MDCHEYKEQINLFVDGELDIKIHMELFKHLAVCQECQGFVDGLIRMKETRKKEIIQYPTELDEAILSEISTLKKSRSNDKQSISQRIAFWKQPVGMPISLATAFAVIILILGFLVGGILNRSYDKQTISTTIPTNGLQQPTVIMIYGIPPIDVIGQPLERYVKNKNNL
jgi:hypothetical protein